MTGDLKAWYLTPPCGQWELGFPVSFLSVTLAGRDTRLSGATQSPDHTSHFLTCGLGYLPPSLTPPAPPKWRDPPLQPSPPPNLPQRVTDIDAKPEPLSPDQGSRIRPLGPFWGAQTPRAPIQPSLGAGILGSFSVPPFSDHTATQRSPNTEKARRMLRGK